MADTSEDAMVKICDFGISIYCDFDYVEVKEIQGTPTFMAPENLAMKYSYKSDVWSIGVMTYHLLHS
jgi:serine/threonine protein kinase